MTTGGKLLKCESTVTRTLVFSSSLTEKSSIPSMVGTQHAVPTSKNGKILSTRSAPTAASVVASLSRLLQRVEGERVSGVMTQIMRTTRDGRV